MERAGRAAVPHLRFCYGVGALPAAAAEEAAPVERFDPLQALALSHPDLYREAAAGMREAVDERGATLLLRNPIAGAWRRIHDLLADELPVLRDAADNPYFLCHQGDWESLTLELNPTRLDDPPLALVLARRRRRGTSACPDARGRHGRAASGVVDLADPEAAPWYGFGGLGRGRQPRRADGTARPVALENPLAASTREPGAGSGDSRN